MLGDEQHTSLRESEKQVEDNWHAEHGGAITKVPNLPNLLVTPTPAPLNLGNDPGKFCPAVAPNTVQSVIVQPLANQHYTSSVPLKVEPGTLVCAKPLFNLRFQVYVPSAGVWQDEPVLAQVDMAAHPQGISLQASSFAPYTQKGTLKQWRVAAQLTGNSAHPWSGWTSFTLN